ncbi:M20 family metallopeptidase [Paenibacillus sp. GCM10012307]|uniref:Amidohydrolase n=1 Tax=Paenibacillus roseus TaxID=2798579 RepID=A0A934J1X1_9BACL|nr:amidohydrolase [Paenibacillus roseus]MBJ6363286.1 amidohydrolase [Paenibacillus roseus]
MTESFNDVRNMQSLYSAMVGWRRYLHRHPELSYEEKQTSLYIAEQLRAMGCEPVVGVGGHGLTVLIQGEKPGPVVALRADIDALPIQDQKQVDYISTVPGVMHACGHDAHTATLLGIAKYYMDHRSALAGARKLIFQPAEESTPGGALPMIREGVLENVDAIYGVHLWTPLPVGMVASKSGAFMAAPDEFYIDITGRGGHGGLPHETIDAIIIGSALVSALQTIISRNVNPLEPAVISVGSFQAGSTTNVIAETAHLRGTVRTFNPDTRKLIRQRMEEMIQQTCSMYGGKGVLDYREGYPTVVNDADEIARFFKVGGKLLPQEQVQQSGLIMAGEDFSYYLQQRRGCFMFVGAGNPEKGARYPHHHPLFDIDENAMLISANLLIGMAEDFASSQI